MKMILKLTMLATIVILFGLGCQKTDLLDESGKVNPNKMFNAATAKLWYYKYFENSTQGKLNNGKKIPVWKNEFYHKVGNLEIIEFPLIMAKKQLPVPSKLSLADKKRIADASLSKIKFTKNEQGEIFVTEVTYIPDMEYLQKKNFDISNTGYGKPSDDFTGQMIIKKWNDKLLSINVVTNGKITGKKSIVRNNSVAAKSNNNEPDANFIEVNCEPDGIEKCEIQQDCWVYPDGMVISCGDWFLIVGSCYCEPNEGGGGDEPDDCELHGIGCDDGPPPPPSDNPPVDECVSILAAFQSMTQQISPPVPSDIGFPLPPDANGIIKKTNNPKGRYHFYTLLNYTSYFRTYYHGMVYKNSATDPTWKWETLVYACHLRTGEVPPCMTATATYIIDPPVINANQTDALATGNFTVIYTITCGLDSDLKVYEGSIYETFSSQ